MSDASDLPVIISLEVHAGPEQQEIMVEIMQSSFRGLLVSDPPTDNPTLPSPAALRKKILIKVKYTDPEKAAAHVAGRSVGRPSLRHHDTSKSTSSSDSATSTKPSDTSLEKQDGKKKKPSSIIPSLSALGIYTRSYHFSSLASPDALVPTHIFSLSEKKFMKMHSSHGPTLFSHNRNFLMRAFPSGLRVRSDNLDPAVFWRKGVQMVALNWQRWDEGMMLNEGMFNGSAGWVLKPPSYLGDNHPTQQGTDPIKAITTESQSSQPHNTLTLRLSFFAAQSLPPPPNTHLPSFRPYFKTELHVEKPAERTGAPIEGGGKSKEKEGEKDGKYKHSSPLRGRGREMDFGGERVEWVGVEGVVESLSFVRYLVPPYTPKIGLSRSV